MSERFETTFCEEQNTLAKEVQKKVSAMRVDVVQQSTNGLEMSSRETRAMLELLLTSSILIADMQLLQCAFCVV